MNVQELTNYFLARLKEKFTGKLLITFDKGIIVCVDRTIRDDAAQFR